MRGLQPTCSIFQLGTKERNYPEKEVELIMKRIKLIFLLTISLALVMVVVQNTAPVNERFLCFR